MEDFVQSCLGVSEAGHLTIGGADTVALAKEYGTPCYVMDEAVIRSRMRMYTEAFGEFSPNGGGILFASKACCFKAMYRIAAEEGILGADAVSPGELRTASAAGFPMEKIYFHGNNKTDADVAFAMDAGVGTFVADNDEELEAIEAQAAKRGLTQRVLLRITPGIDTHTYEAVNTGKVDSKFGNAIATGQAEARIRIFITLKSFIKLA